MYNIRDGRRYCMKLKKGYNMIIDTYKSINDNIQNIVKDVVDNMPKSVPCRVEEVKKNRVKVSRLGKNSNITGYVDNVPIVRCNSFAYPIKKGDIGVLLAIDYSARSYVTNSLIPPKTLTKATNGAGYLYLPLAPDDTNFTESNDTFELYSLNGENSIKIHNDSITITDTNKNNIVFDDKGVLIEDTNSNTITASSDGVVVEDANGNTITTSSSGVKIEDANGNVFEMGSSSVKINSNLEVLQ